MSDIVYLEIDPQLAMGRGFARREKPSLNLMPVPNRYRHGGKFIVPLTNDEEGMEFARRYLLTIEGQSEHEDYMTFRKYDMWFTYSVSPCTWQLSVFMVGLYYAPIPQRDSEFGVHCNYATSVIVPELAGIETDRSLAIATVIANRCAGVRVIRVAGETE